MVTPPDMEPGYEVATERGPGVEWWDGGKWVLVDSHRGPLCRSELYRRPIPKREEKKMSQPESEATREMKSYMSSTPPKEAAKFWNGKEWAVAMPPFVTTNDIHGCSYVTPVLEAARIAQLPEVQAEVERQRAEREIGDRDWFRHDSGAVDKCIRRQGSIIQGLDGVCRPANTCTKIPGPPEFIAFLEEGVKP